MRDPRNRSPIQQAVVVLGCFASLSVVGCADAAIVDGDGGTPLGVRDLNWGRVCASDTTTGTAVFGAERGRNTGSADVFADGATIFADRPSQSEADGNSFGVDSVSPGVVTLPNNWSSLPNGTDGPMFHAVLIGKWYKLGPTTTGTWAQFTIFGQSAAGIQLRRLTNKVHPAATVIDCDRPTISVTGFSNGQTVILGTVMPIVGCSAPVDPRPEITVPGEGVYLAQASGVNQQTVMGPTVVSDTRNASGVGSVT